MKRIHTFLAVLLLGLMSLGAQAQQRDDDLAVDEPTSTQERPQRQERGARGGAPSLRDVNQAARDGDLPKARAMIDEVLQRNPDNARAHFVKAQLAARDRDLATARAELQEAERLAPGLPFAREQAVSNLRKRLERMESRDGRGERPRTGRNQRQGEPQRPADAPMASGPSPSDTATSSQDQPVETRPAGGDTRNMGSGAPAESAVAGNTSSLLIGVLIGAAVVAVLAALLFRRRRPGPG
jgi:hypothetical protein